MVSWQKTALNFTQGLEPEPPNGQQVFWIVLDDLLRGRQTLPEQ
jgi:hypothetical protein